MTTTHAIGVEKDLVEDNTDGVVQYLSIGLTQRRGEILKR